MSRYFTKTLAALEPYVPGEQLKIDDLVKLNANENPYPPAPGVAAAVAAAVPGLRLYSDLSNRALNEAIAAHWGVQPENILCGNGSDENLLLALRAFCDENTPLAFADVTYSFYPVLCDLLHIPQHVIPLEDDLTIDLKKYCGLHETIVIANPNAPTSLLAPVAAIEEVLRTNPDNIVVVDETYVEFAPAGSSCLPLLEKYENLVITHTFSKTHNLAGARLGYCIARPGLITDMNRVKFSYSPYNVNSMTQAAGTAAIRDEAYFHEVTLSCWPPAPPPPKACASAVLPCSTRPPISCLPPPTACPARKFLRNCGRRASSSAISTRRAFPTTCASPSAPTLKCSASLRRWMRF